MKYILLAGWLLLTTQTFGRAYTSLSNQEVSKNIFYQKSDELNTFIGQGKTKEAMDTWGQIDKMILEEFIIIEGKIKEAAKTHNDDAKSYFTNVLKVQRETYDQILGAKDNMTANRAQLYEKLVQFSFAIL